MFSIVKIKNLLIKQHRKPNIDVSNKIKPCQVEFKSTKDLFEYSKNRCVNALRKEQPYEHALIVDTKKNTVIAEYVGGYRKCKIEDLNQLALDMKNTAIIHGHSENYPISIPDVKTLINSGINKVIAFNSKGEFSIVAKQKELTLEYSKHLKSMANETYVEKMEHNDLYKSYLDYNLRKHIPLMGLRYVSNYTFFK